MPMKHITPVSLLLSLSLAACTPPADEPKIIADRYWQLLQNGKLIEAEKLVSKDSRHAFSEHSRRMVSVVQLDSDEARTIISTTITTINPDTKYIHRQTFDTVLVLQQGQWKIDANQSTLPPALNPDEEELQRLTEELSDSMQDNIESIDEAMEQGMQMLNQALHEGSQEMSESLLRLLNELNGSMQESIDKMKQRRNQQEQQLQEKQAPLQRPQPDPAQGEGMI